MEGTTLINSPPLHSSKPLPRRKFNRLFAPIYASAIIVLLLHNFNTVIESTSFQSLIISLLLLISNVILSFMWLNSQAFRMNPVVKIPYPDTLKQVLHRSDFPALDVFICTADPTKEPPSMVAATVLSVLAYDYQPEKLSVYVSDDGGSELTLFGLMEAAEFAKVWLPFCDENQIMERSPNAYFSRNSTSSSEDHLRIKVLYEDMKRRVDNVVAKGSVGDDEYRRNEVLKTWTQGFTALDHPAVIQVISQSGEDKDVAGCSMPNLIYVSRQKSPAFTHQFKAGALNTLLRVSEIMTNAPIILTLDCDMISNDPSTPHKMLCFFMDSSIRPKLGYVQFPARFHGLNKADIYGSEMKRMYHLNPEGLNGLLGPDYFGTGTFFNRRVFYGDPSSILEPNVPELGLKSVVSKPINNQANLESAHRVAGCDYENRSVWGSKMGFRYGSLVEDYYTGLRLHCQGWRSIYCNPERPAFLAEMPIALNDVVTQMKRWAVGLLEVAISKYSPLTFGTRYMGSLMAHCYCYYAFGPILSFPIVVYSFLPQITLLNSIYIFPSVSSPWFLLHIFLFIGSYGQDCMEFVITRSTAQRWWNDQRMWLIRGLSSDLFGSLEYISNRLGIAPRGFDITNKAMNNDQIKRYDAGRYEFGVALPMFVPLSTAAVLNLAAFIYGLLHILKREEPNVLFMSMLISGFGIVNCLPVYEAMVLRIDGGRMPIKITVISVCLAWSLYYAVRLQC